ncbi:MAG: mannose-1-phosphate guanylyltransferase/mannose-6-phosphate isomerase [Holosporales bacterium]
MSVIVPVILAGGSGTRLWPLSRSHMPKQYVALMEDESLFQKTLGRFKNRPSFAEPVIVANKDHSFLIQEQMANLDLKADVILEPCGKNTAPSVALAAFHALTRSADAILVVLPADHLIAKEDPFFEALEQAVEAATHGCLVTFGITPTFPETGYGYIEGGETLEGSGVEKVKKFIEKPNLERAQQLLAQGGVYWNSGMFVFKAKTYLEELRHFNPKMYDLCNQCMQSATWKNGQATLSTQMFESLPANSIDYEVMERTDKAAVVPADLGWSDVGSFTALWDHATKDHDANAHVGDVISVDSRGCYVRAEAKPIAVVGVEDLVVIGTKDATLVAHRSSSQNVRDVVKLLQDANRIESQHPAEVRRPWGSYESIDSGSGYQVKRITVKPGQKLSLQKHHHRAEHWTVVEGEATVTVGDRVMALKPDQSVYIPIGEVHRLENNTGTMVTLIEVQVGAYLGEDDIVRLEDIYNRVP